MVPLLIIVIRLVVPFSILRFPLLGMVASILADAVDIMLLEKFALDFLVSGRYHFFDKIFDIYYLFFALLVALTWKNITARRIAAFLFLWRFIGVFVFEIIKWRGIFLLAPNIFENFYLAVTVFGHFRQHPELRARHLIILLVFVSIPKFVQEYIMHYLEFPTWIWFRDHFFFWFY